jgi:predicted glycosyltransferase involved in capsule biosynthesis
MFKAPAYTIEEQTSIVNSIVLACSNISSLTKEAHDYLFLCKGFQLKPFDWYRTYYWNLSQEINKVSLRLDLLKNAKLNTTNIPKDDYSISKATIYRRIIKAIS